MLHLEGYMGSDDHPGKVASIITKELVGNLVLWPHPKPAEPEPAFPPNPEVTQVCTLQCAKWWLVGPTPVFCTQMHIMVRHCPRTLTRKGGPNLTVPCHFSTNSSSPAVP